MIWLTWRQHRLILAAGFVLAVALVAWMLVVEHDYTIAQHAIARSCPTASLGIGPVSDLCSVLERHLFVAEDQAGVIIALPIFIPVLAGVLLGAPLVAGELERHTVLLAFTQGISRTRWLVTRWLTLVVPVAVVASLLAWVTNWWFWHLPSNPDMTGVVVGSASRIQPGTFDAVGIVPVAYTVFAFALGTASGAVLRRTFWAGLATVAAFFAARLSFVHWVRPNLVAPRFQPEQPGGAVPFVTGSQPWELSTGYRDAPGSRASLSPASIRHVGDLCVRLGSNYDKCLAAHGIQFGTTYQPASRFWILQWSEAAIFVVMAAALFGITLWAVRRWRA